MRGHAISSSGFPSDTNMLVDACIARVRETARLDDDAVLPPLPRVAPRRDVVIFSKDQTAGSAAGSAARSTPVYETAVDEWGGRSDFTKLVSRRSGSGRSRWALAFCAMVASAFGTAAFLASPAGHAPSVVRATSAARAQMSAAAHATAALFTR
ncbi:MAG: hypothetical protein QOI41_2105 [Myxococcales bacterium]|nr:hypothetical protein [Myxococcales bacterium]